MIFKGFVVLLVVMMVAYSQGMKCSLDKNIFSVILRRIIGERYLKIAA